MPLLKITSIIIKKIKITKENNSVKKLIFEDYVC